MEIEDKQPEEQKVAVKTSESAEKGRKFDILDWRLFLEHPTAYLSVFTVLALSYALLFNVGYFYPLGIEFLTFLTLKDVLEATLPFMLVGLLSILAVMFVDVLADDDESFKGRFQRYFIDDLKEYRLVVKLVGWIIITPFFLFNLIGSYILYYWFFLRLQTFSKSISNGENLTIFSSGIIPWIVATVVVVFVDLFIRSRPNQYKARKMIMRLALLSGAICLFEGSAFLARQLSTDVEWDIGLANGHILVNHVVLRSSERGVIIFDRDQKSVSIVLFSELKSVTKSLKKGE